MKAVILAAGEGLRCRPLTLTRSKVMLPVANRPIMEHVIDSLEKNNIKDLIIIVGYKKERIMDYFEDGIDFGVNITYKEQKAQLGTAHAIKQACTNIDEGEAFLVLNGDNIIEPATIGGLIKDKTADVTILTTKREHTHRYGVVITKGKEVTHIVEKPASEVSHFINTGIYLFKSGIFENIEQTTISHTGEYAITDTIQQMIDNGSNVKHHLTNALWLDAVYAWDLLDANSTVLEVNPDPHINGIVEQGAVIRGNVTIGKNTIIRSGSYIVGPAIIGDNCEIGPNVVILPATTIGDYVSISAFSHILNSIIMNDVRTGTHGVISNSVVGFNDRIGSFFVTEDKANIMIELEGELHTAEKLGAIIGDDNIIGSNVLTKAGSMISSNCHIDSGVIISKKVPENSRVL